MDLQTLLQSILNFLRNNGSLILVLLFVAYKYYKSKQPFPVTPGSRVISIESETQWNDMVRAASQSGKWVLADFYAVWCPPCRAAAPAFAKMSMVDWKWRDEKNDEQQQQPRASGAQLQVETEHEKQDAQKAPDKDQTPERSLIFAKIDVDKVPQLAAKYEVRAMPTFKLFNPEAQEMDVVTGWSEASVRNIIAKRGFKEV